MDKAKWINSSYLKDTPNCCLKPFINFKDDRYSDDKVDMIIDLAKDRVDFKHDLNDIVDIFFDDVTITSTKKLDDNYKSVMTLFIDKIDSLDFNDKDLVKNTIYNLCNDVGTKMGKVMPGLRMALVGGVSGPDLITTMMILGKKSVKDRISNSITFDKVL